MKILVTPTSLTPDKKSAALDALRSFADEIIYNPHGRPLVQAELKELLAGCDGFVAGLDYIDADVINSCDKLKVISRYGAGVDRVDLEAAKAKGIVVCNTPGANTQAVADLTLGLMLAVARKIPVLDAKTKAGGWVRSTGMELYGKTLGIMGLGSIGKAVAKRALGFSMKVLAYGPRINTPVQKEYCDANGIITATVEEVAKQSDFISLHSPLIPETRHIINSELMQMMKPGVIIVNTSRGGLIDEDAALKMLETGHLGGLGLDAFEQEPLGETEFAKYENVVLTPHTASHTKEATTNMADMAIQNLMDVLEGKECKYIV